MFLLVAEVLKAQDPKYTLVWSDEFNYRGLPDSTKWAYDTVGNLWQWGNNELQQYTSFNKENAFVSNGALKIQVVDKGGRITSARLQTKASGSWKYARIEIKAKMASGRGLWSAAWLLPVDWEFSDGYIDGEIDFAEHVGFTSDSIYQAIHTYTHGFDSKETFTTVTPIADCETEYHRYAVEWSGEYIQFFVDDTLTSTYLKSEHRHLRWTFNQSYFLLLNVAVGGSWAASDGIDYDCFPAQMAVDYVRVYRVDK